MKKILFVLAIAALFTSCAPGPEKAAEKFLDNMSKGKVDEAKKYATEPTGKLLDFASSFGQLPVEPDFKFNFVKDSIVDSKAWVTFANQNGTEEVIELVKIDGDWKVNIQMDK